MRFITMVKAAEDIGPPPPELMAAMEKATAEGIQAGTVLDTAGLAPSAMGARVRLSNRKVRVIDGPFTEAKELVGGYAILQARSKEDAVEAATRIIQLHKEHWPSWEGEIEVRQLFGPEDVAPPV
jgi:hypothetical protein